jgi:hypothetical protein
MRKPTAHREPASSSTGRDDLDSAWQHLRKRVTLDSAKAAYQQAIDSGYSEAAAVAQQSTSESYRAGSSVTGLLMTSNIPH